MGCILPGVIFLCLYVGLTDLARNVTGEGAVMTAVGFALWGWAWGRGCRR